MLMYNFILKKALGKWNLKLSSVALLLLLVLLLLDKEWNWRGMNTPVCDVYGYIMCDVSCFGMHNIRSPRALLPWECRTCSGRGNR